MQVLNRISRNDFDPDKIIERQIGAVGRKTKLISFSDAILLIMVIPGKAAMKACIMFSDIIRRYLGGDKSLIVEISANAQSDDPIAQIARASIDSLQHNGSDALQDSALVVQLNLKRKCDELELQIKNEIRGGEFEFIANASKCLCSIRNNGDLDAEEKQALRSKCLRIIQMD